MDLTESLMIFAAGMRAQGAPAVVAENLANADRLRKCRAAIPMPQDHQLQEL
jgi:flagellar basal body rod protein FlgC